jgi:uncharacterized protein YprB with RNaseH-like and TPR domain
VTSFSPPPAVQELAASRRPVVPAGLLSGENRYGRVVFRDEFFPLDHRHGRVRLEGALAADEVLAGRLGPRLTSSHLRRAAYLDIETTGLGGPIDGFAFLVGVGTFDNLSFRVRQFFLRQPAEEPAMLAALSETLDRCDCLVTFNGRTFDVPQLAARYALAGQPSPFDGLPHADLLHPARRLHGRALPSCRLGDVEHHLLGLQRKGDIPSSQVGAVYLAALRRRNARSMHPLFEHNSLDVLSLAAFLAYLQDDAGAEVEADAPHHMALARWDEAAGRTPGAIEQYRRVVGLDAATALGGEALRHLDRLLRKEEDWLRCAELWRRELDQTASPLRAVRAHIELAKLLERRLKLPSQALEHAERAAALIDASSFARFFATSRQALDVQVVRLRERVAKAAEKPSRRRREPVTAPSTAPR